MTDLESIRGAQRIPTGDAVDSALTPSSYVTEETLREGDPQEHEAIHLYSADEKFTVGTWRAEPYSEFIESYPGDEYARIVEGSLTLTGDDGVAERFSAGEAYTMRRGWRGEFRVTATVTKQFAQYTP